MKSYTPIQCSHHDYIEIACLHHYELNIEFTSGEWIRGIADTTQTNTAKEEHLIVRIKGVKRAIRLDFIRSITPIDKNAVFTKTAINDLNDACQNTKRIDQTLKQSR